MTMQQLQAPGHTRIPQPCAQRQHSGRSKAELGSIATGVLPVAAGRRGKTHPHTQPGLYVHLC